MEDDIANDTADDAAADASKAAKDSDSVPSRRGGLKKNLVPILIVAAALVAGPKLAGSTPSATPAADAAVAPAHGAGGATGGNHGWSYEGETGPEAWSELDDANAACAAGTQQSPVDLVAPLRVGLTDLGVDYAPARVEVVDNGHTIQLAVPSGSSLALDGQTFELAQVHGHAPSEHTLAGERFPLELHLVHQDVNGSLAVIGVLVREGVDEPALAPAWSLLGTLEAGVPSPSPEPVDLGALLPDDRTAIRYVGSLTTPPCTEGVRWVVLAEPIELSGDQIGAFTARYAHNSRPVQPLHGRTLVVDAAADG